MSSSRSIASARQKRSGEQGPNGQQGHPVTSISSAQMFAQQQQKQQQQHQQQHQHQPQRFPQKQQQQPEYPQPTQNAKISVGDAFGLVTIRLGRVESILQKMEEDGNTMIGQNNSQTNDAVILNIMNRLQDLEKNQQKIQAQMKTSREVQENSNIDIEKIYQDISSISQDIHSKNSLDLINKTHELKQELNEAKLLLENLQSFTIETNQKLLELMENSRNNIITTESFNVDEANDSENGANDTGLLEEDITTGVNLQEEIEQLQTYENVGAELNE